MPKPRPTEVYRIEVRGTWKSRYEAKPRPSNETAVFWDREAFEHRKHCIEEFQVANPAYDITVTYLVATLNWEEA